MGHTGTGARGSPFKYLVKWAGFDDEQTWEPAKNLVGNEVLAAYLQSELFAKIAKELQDAQALKDGAKAAKVN